MKISFRACALLEAIRFCMIYLCRTACRPPMKVGVDAPSLSLTAAEVTADVCVDFLVEQVKAGAQVSHYGITILLHEPAFTAQFLSCYKFSTPGQANLRRTTSQSSPSLRSDIFLLACERSSRRRMSPSSL